MTKEELHQYINNNLISNTTGKITANTLKNVLNQIVDICYNDDENEQSSNGIPLGSLNIEDI